LQPRWRKRIWLLFSIVFFLQLILGIAGLGMFLMSGELHLPIPALILAGPLYRWEFSFMPILFAASMLALGPAWCSYLCYFGAWDGVASRARKAPAPFTKWRNPIRIAILVAVFGAAPAMRVLGVPPLVATWAGAAFGMGGIAVMLLVSRKSGVMAHCVAWCPLGLVANTVGRVSPFRVGFSDGCTNCMACTTACRYDALGKAQVMARKPGSTCTLCGDCIARCRHDSIGYRFLGLSPESARRAFIVTAAVMHTLFIGIAMT
ncbi:MAG: 4Fe-4S binding protein, partial [Rectinemataceae bacterium]